MRVIAMVKARRWCVALAVFGRIFLSVPPSFAFKPRYHGDITRQILRGVSRTIDGHTLRFTSRAIDQIVENNTNQDNGWCITGSPSPPFSVSGNHCAGEDWAGGTAPRVPRL